MREFDTNGLRLAEFQAKLFEAATLTKSCSSAIFLRRFLHSNLLIQMDKNESALISLDPNYGLYLIDEEFGETNYGKEKINKDIMFWMGYLYRYISYTRNTETPFVMNLFDYKQLVNLYSVYHTQDPEWCIRSLLELNNLPEQIFDKNWRLKQTIRKRDIS